MCSARKERIALMNMPSEKAEQGMTAPDESEKDRLRQIILDSFSYEFV